MRPQWLNITVLNKVKKKLCSFINFFFPNYVIILLQSKEKCNFIQMIIMKGESYTKRVNKLKEEVRMMLEKVVDPVNHLELIDIYLAKTWFIIPF